MDIDKRIDDAAEKFKEIAKPNKNHYSQKFRSLPFWLGECSHYFELEANNELINDYYYYPRGSVISVNFGVNEGSEFSNLHFAVVLDKRDSSKKRTLTVIPLTSKAKPNLFYLGKEIFNQTSSILLANISSMEKEVKNLNKENDKANSELNQLKEAHKQNNQKAKIINEKINNIEHDPNMEDSDKLSALQQLYLELIAKTGEIKELSSKVNNLKKKSCEISQKTNEYYEKLQDLKRVVDIYAKYNKNTFARIEDITTISKLRIHKINEFDPSGQIRLSSEQMKNISDKLMQLYITKN